MRIRLGLSLLALAMFSGITAAQGSGQKPSREWKRVTVDNLEVVGNGSAKDLTGALTQVQAFRSTLESLLPGLKGDKGGAPTTLVVLNAGSFEKFLPRDGRGRKQYGVVGYFTDLPDQNFMVIPVFETREDTYEVAFHEYTHYVISRRAKDLPRWLDEGLAEFYSTFQVRDGYGLVGKAPAGRLRWIDGPTRLPHVRQLLTGDLQLFRNFGDTLGFYAQSWLVVHYMILGEEGRRKEQFARYLDLARQKDPELAAREAFGISFDELDRAIRLYGQRARLPALRVGTPLNALKLPPVEPLGQLDALTLQARLLVEVGGAREAEPLIDEALAIDRTSRAARLLQGRLRLWQRRYPEALDDFAAAAETGPPNFPAAYYRANGLYASGNFEAALKAFDTAVELRPGSAPAWFGLSIASMALGRQAQADVMLERARALDPRPRWYATRALEAVKHHQDAVALSDARTFIDMAGLSEETSAYAAFLGVIASRRLGTPEHGQALLARVSAVLDTKSWAKVVADYMAGVLDDAEFLRRARDDGQRTEARTYIALRLLHLGRRDEALVHLEWVRDKGERNYTEYDLALSELARLARSSAGQ